MSAWREAAALIRHRPRRTPATVAWWLICVPFFTRTFRPPSAKPKVSALVCAGACLRPWLDDGDVVVYDTALVPVSGDLVVTRTWFDVRAGLGTKARRIPLYGAKQLRIDAAGRRWLTCADGSYLDTDHEIVGVATSCARRPWRKPPPMSELEFPIRPIAAQAA